MITLAWLYILAGIAFTLFAVLSAADRTNGKQQHRTRLGNRIGSDHCFKCSRGWIFGDP